MPEYVISCCTSADLPRAYFNTRSVPLGYFKVTMEGRTFPDDLGDTMPLKEFYEKIKAGEAPVTSQLNVDDYIALFEPVLSGGSDLLHLALSSGISGSYNSAKIAEVEMKAKYPERKLYIIDSLAASSGYGLLVDTALDMRDEGMGIDDLAKWIEENKTRLHHWFFTSDLKYLKRGGRVSATAAVVGTLLGICPVLNVSLDGKLVPRLKVRGKKNTIIEMGELIKKHAEGGTGYKGKCFISNSACFEDARVLADIIEDAFTEMNGKVEIFDIGTTVGAHTGPGTVALFFWGDKRAE